ncbi:YbhB/YbcL family Raf kinase inhibitor-like protein [Danxiaibacter flavus]|uniref:YbhB/YbcL family Raf kinase inhibitor-like protein n=1 Tax=Danxiaibacter flavus TaxID=3049108 RepID=A0ABV3ZEB5_9BACT|nr:YbhB/YbcL family Raf kinase inhibitor-like protein [Chitinophagaceae bacterium DXS]
MINSKQKVLTISSTAFNNETNIPVKYTCDGDDTNPPLTITDIPEEAHSLAIIMEDPDAPKGTFTHWLVWNIPVSHHIKEHANPGISGNNSAGKTGYHGPCPPSGSHRYYFHVYALNDKLDLPVGADRASLEKSMTDHILAQGSIMAHYQRAGK